MSEVFNFIVENDDVLIRFSCPNHGKRIAEIIRNLKITEDNEEMKSKKESLFSVAGDGYFKYNGNTIKEKDIRMEAVFFENTDYPLIARGKSGKNVSNIVLSLNGHPYYKKGEKRTIICDGGEMYGSLNFHNQVGKTDFILGYNIGDSKIHRELKFTTEVLSYKLDYRSDMKEIISDIENEYAMLSMSFLKDTYLNMRSHGSETNNLIWWQIFKSCYNEILAAASDIINRPKRRLHNYVQYERAERMPVMPQDMENEYINNKNNPSHLYRIESMMLSHDTIENRFLKYALKEMLRRFISIKEHILTSLHLTNTKNIDTSLDNMEKDLRRINNHPFFRGIGVFKGFRQDNLVMKQAHGYKTIMQKWVELLQGYELEEGVHKLEVKDISDLYEIWCFIKVKNIVQEVLGELGTDVTLKTNGKAVSSDFIPKLIYGGSMSFIDNDNIELACVSYNAQIEKENTKRISAVADTDTLTTVQRPDIVLQLTKRHNDGMKYTYLFDAKYRIDDTKIDGYEVPPETTINQMHRYRDAIYYTQKVEDKAYLKKEIIAGYVLFPGNIKYDALNLDNGNYCYQVSNRKIGIGAFPLRPKKELKDNEGNIIINPDDSEKALHDQIKRWMEAEDGAQLLDRVIPQKGTFVEVGNRVLVGNVKSSNDSKKSYNDKYLKKFEDGKATLYYTGKSFPTTIPLHNLHYFIPYIAEYGVRDLYEVTGIRTITKAEALNITEDKPEDDLRIGLEIKFVRKLSDDYRKIDTRGMAKDTFLDITFEELSKRYI